jgi:leukotriene-A4 hydrolase
MKYNRALYRALALIDLELAQESFLKHKTFYHPIARDMIAKDLHL